ncbi:MAG: RedB protein [Bdellovibrionales bacterium]
MARISKDVSRPLLLFAWISLIGTGYWSLFLYSNTAGSPAAAQTNWPGESVLKPQPGLATLVVFAHPHCPCSKATVGELARLMPYVGNKAKIFVTFFKPKTRPLGWAQGSLWRDAAAIPGAEVTLDEDGTEAEKFGAKTSGQVFLYGADGKLVFQGGITPERGHMGDSDGRLAIISFLETGHVEKSSTPVFGCSIRNPERAAQEEI